VPSISVSNKDFIFSFNKSIPILFLTLIFIILSLSNLEISSFLSKSILL